MTTDIEEDYGRTLRLAMEGQALTLGS